MGATTIRRAQPHPAGEVASAQTGTPVAQQLGAGRHGRAAFIPAPCRTSPLASRSQAWLADAHMEIPDAPRQVAADLHEGDAQRYSCGEPSPGSCGRQSACWP